MVYAVEKANHKLVVSLLASFIKVRKNIMKKLEPASKDPFQNISINEKLTSEFLHSNRKIVIPQLSTDGYKGCQGKICIVGGSHIYSGAPFFSAITTLKIGAELCFVLTSKESAKPLKCYSPDLIVYPFLYNNRTKDEDLQRDELKHAVDYLSEKIDAAVIGPGLGSIDARTEICLQLIIKKFTQKNVILVFDAEGINFIIKNEEMFNIIKHYKNTVFTPNKNEYRKMIQHFMPDFDLDLKKKDINEIIYSAHFIKKHVNEINILIKGNNDVFISNHFFFTSYLEESNPKRVGGLGDVVAGAVAMFLCWAAKTNKSNFVWRDEFIDKSQNSLISQIIMSNVSEFLNTVAAYNGSFFVKSICKEAFKKKHRGVITSDVIDEIPHLFYKLYETQENKETK